MEKIGDGCFCKAGIEAVTLPSTLRKVEDNAFQNCASLKHVTFAPGSRLEKIGTQCFARSGLEEVILPPSVQVIGASAFMYCR